MDRLEEMSRLEGRVVPNRIEYHFLSLLRILFTELAGELDIHTIELDIPLVNTPYNAVKRCIRIEL